MFRVAICDDNERTCNLIDQVLFNYGEENKIKLDIEIYCDGESLHNALGTGKTFDLIFLDIEMGSISGIDIGREIRVKQKNYDMEIVYVSGKPEYSRELLSMRPLDFIDKPVCASEVIRVLELAMSLFGEASGYFYFTSNGQTERIRYSKILYFEKALRKIVIHTDDNIFEFYGKFIDFTGDLPKYFMQINRSFLVNLHRIQSYGVRSVTMDDGSMTSIGEQYREAFTIAQKAELEKRGMM